MALASPGRIKAGQAYIEITSDSAKLVSGIKKAQERVVNFGQSLKGLGTNMVLMGSLTSYPLLRSLGTYSDFDDKIRTLAATLSTTVDKITPLKTLIQELGATTAFSASQVAQGAIDLAHTGFAANELKYVLKPTLNLVRATGEELDKLGEVAEQAGAIARMYGKEVEDFKHVTNVMAYAANESAMGITDLAEAMKMAGPYAKLIGENIEDSAAALMLMANMGVKGSLAGTSLRNIYLTQAAAVGNLNDQNEEIQKTGKQNLSYFTQLGIKLKDTSGKMRSTTAIMQDLALALKRAPNDYKAKALMEQFGMRGSIGAANMASDTQGFLTKATNNLKKLATENENYAATIADAQESGLGGFKRSSLAQFEAMQISFGEGFWQLVAEYKKGISNSIGLLHNFIESNKKLFATLALGTGAFVGIGVALFAFGILLKGYGLVVAGFAKTIGLLASVLKLPIVAFQVLSGTISTFTSVIKIGVGSLLAITKSIKAISKVVLIQSHALKLLTGAWKIYKMTGVVATQTVGVAFKQAFTALKGMNIIGNLAGKLLLSFSNLGVAILAIAGGVYIWERWGSSIKKTISNAFSDNKSIDSFKNRAIKAFESIKKDGALAIKSIQQSLEIKDFAGALKTAFAGLKVVLLEAIDPFMLAWDKFKADNHGWMAQIKSFLGYYYGKIKIAALKDKHEAERAQEEEYVMRDTGRVNAAGQKVYEKFYKPQKDEKRRAGFGPNVRVTYHYSEKAQKQLAEWTKIAAQNEVRRANEMKALEAEILKSENSDLQTPDVVGNMKKREVEIKKARAELKSKVKEANAFAKQYNLLASLTSLFENQSTSIYKEDKSSIKGQAMLNAEMSKFDSMGIDQREVALRDAIKAARENILSIKQEFEKYKEGVLADKVVTTEEQNKLREFILRLGEANTRLGTLKNKLDATNQETQNILSTENKRQSSVKGGWSLREYQSTSAAEKLYEVNVKSYLELQKIRKNSKEGIVTSNAKVQYV